MKRLTILVLGVATLAACNGGGGGDTRKDTFPYHSGGVVERMHDDFGWALRLQTVVPHQGEVQGWQPVSHAVYDHCPVGEHWREDNANGCG